MQRRHAAVRTLFRKGEDQEVARSGVETDGYPGQVRRSFRYRQQERPFDDAEVSAQDAEGSRRRETVARLGKVVLDCREDRFGLYGGFMPLFRGEK
ncbi:MAG: hypothetical protein ACOCYC_00600 [bacterium]